jgi:hypothetical protein
MKKNLTKAFYYLFARDIRMSSFEFGFHLFWIANVYAFTSLADYAGVAFTSGQRFIIALVYLIGALAVTLLSGFLHKKVTKSFIKVRSKEIEKDGIINNITIEGGVSVDDLDRVLKTIDKLNKQIKGGQ